MPGTLIESPGSIMDEVWASTSRESSAIVIYFDYGFIGIDTKPYKGLECYDSTTLWHIAEKLVCSLKRSIMQPLMLKHEFAICKWTISDPSYCYNNIHLADITI